MIWNLNVIIEDPLTNQFVVRIFDISETLNDSIHEETKFYKDMAIDTSKNNKKTIFFPKYEYTLQKPVKHFQLDASFVKIQYFFLS